MTKTLGLCLLTLILTGCGKTMGQLADAVDATCGIASAMIRDTDENAVATKEAAKEAVKSEEDGPEGESP